MTQRAPRSFLVLLAVGLVVSFSLGMYLEGWQLRWLQDHPISVNLISGVIAFCSGFLTLAIGYNWLVDADWIKRRARQTMAQWHPLAQDVASAYAAYANHSSAITLANVNWAPIDPGHDAVSFAGQRQAAERFRNAGLAAKDPVLRFIEVHAESGSRATAVAAQFFDALERDEDTESAHRAWDRLVTAVEADVRRRHRRERASDPDR
ncbi:hypothetical protein [Kutzneria sp. CA-103260]|uniref:hypothetical protein n=1 Tax=Kutzneria sp. CA-103260 TaxID=2802641 RepID=UPI001BA634AD|nr:hypothetical protein [Kutzneria sp. CA-103260]QUQ63982.1 hypothetical protein JJ691_16990 [Kutzneria sp. CA-103260]